jgi:hypothetical protein
LHHDLARLVVDRDRILTEGVMRMEYPGARTLATMWIDVDDLDAHYLFETHMAIVWPLDEHGLFVDEDSYVESDGDGRHRRTQASSDASASCAGAPPRGFGWESDQSRWRGAPQPFST